MEEAEVLDLKWIKTQQSEYCNSVGTLISRRGRLAIHQYKTILSMYRNTPTLTGGTFCCPKFPLYRMIIVRKLQLSMFILRACFWRVYSFC